MYTDRIKAAIAGTKWASADPRIVEYWMRLDYGVLDHLDRARFTREARKGAQMAIEHPDDSRMLAESYGVKLEGAA